MPITNGTKPVKDATETDFNVKTIDDTADDSSSPCHGVLDPTTGAPISPATSDKQPALDNNKTPVIPAMTTGGHTSAQTNATGTNWTAFGSQACKQLTVSNQTGTTLEFRQGGSGTGFQVPTGAFYTFFGIGNASQLEVRRVDTSNTQVTVSARWES